MIFKPTNSAWQTSSELVPGAAGGPGPGGVVHEFAVVTTALNIGDVVCVTADLSVSKTTVAATHAQRIGVVVGGTQTNMEIHTAVTDVGQLAGNIGDRVLVCVRGIAYVVVDSAIAAGIPIAPSTTTAGRVRPATFPVVAAGAVAVTSAAANGAGTVSGDGFSRIVGQLLAASAANGDVRLALIMPA